MNIYNILKQKKNITNVVSIDEDFNLPPLICSFYSNFEIIEDRSFNVSFLDSDNELSQLGCFSFLLEDNNPIYLNKLHSIDEIKQTFPLASKDEEWLDHNLIRIADIGQVGFGGLYVGCAENNLDQIWIYNSDYDVKYKKVSENIFFFLNLLTFNDEFSDYEGNYSKLYRNWDEDFWRIKE